MSSEIKTELEVDQQEEKKNTLEEIKNKKLQKV